MQFTAQEVMDKVKSFMAGAFFIDFESVGLGDESSFLENGIIDSTGIMEVIQFLETTFGIKVADDEMLPENLDSLANIGSFVIGKTSRHGS